MKTPFDKYPNETWEMDGIQYQLVHYRHYCGYCIFPKRPTIETGYDGILIYVPVHGGITYSAELEDGRMMYGFDCAHAGDDENPLMRDTNWLKAECERMAQGIQLAAKMEHWYISAVTNEKKAKIIDQYHEILRKRGIEFNLQDNFGAMINVMFGGDL